MHIGIVCYPTFGGSGVVATELGMGLANRGHEVHFITYNQPVRLDFISPQLFFHEVLVEEYPLFQYQPYELALSTKLVEIVRKHKLEILHVHYAIPHAYAAHMAKMMLKEKGLEIKVVTTLHGTDITLVGSHPSYKTAVEFSINNSDVVTAVSNSLKQDTLKLFKIRNEVKVVYNFIDTHKYDLEIKNKCQRIAVAKPNQRVLTHMSNFRPVKRIEDVIKIFNIVQNELDSKLLMVGEGPEKRTAESLTKKLGLSKKVIFLGNTFEIAKILCYTDVFLLPSKRESFGLSALEAMAAHTAVVSSNVGGLPEINIHGVTGYLSDPGNFKEMADYALSILRDQDVLKRFKIEARRHSKNFSLQNIVSVYEDIYGSLLKKVPQ